MRLTAPTAVQEWMVRAMRLIDADALKDSLQKIVESNAEVIPQEHFGRVLETVFYINRLIDGQPAIDAVEVVRCRDCSNYINGVCMQTGSVVWGDDYCSTGERRNDDIL